MTTADLTAVEHSAFQRWAILVTVTLALTLYSLAILVVSVLLPQMQGTLSVTQDEIAWVITFNILATAVVTPMTGWLTARFGRRNVMLWGTAGFTAATLGCGMGVVVGPVIGPTLGGYLAELYGWRWAFYMIVPLGMVALMGILAFLTDKGRNRGVRLDWTGFLALSASVVSLQLLLSRGQRLDWFESPEIVIEAVLAAVAFYIFVVHSLSERQPFLNPKLLLDRNYALGLAIVSIYGMLNFTPMVLMPPMLQSLFGYPDSIIGFILGMRGAGAVAGFFAAMWIGKLDPRIGMTLGYLIQAASGVYMASFDVNVSTTDVAINSVMQGFSVGIIWVPLTVATFATLDSRHLAEGSSIYHLLRNLGSSVYISLSVTLVIVSTSINYAGLAEFVSDYNKTLALPWLLGGWSTDDVAGLAALGGEVGRQAALIGYINAFKAYTFACLAALPLVLLVRVRK